MTTVDLQTAKQKILSWIENEERCVTTQRIAQSLNLSRLQASRLLEDISKEQKDVEFQLTLCERKELTEDSIPVTVFRLHHSTFAENCLVALAPSTSTELIATAHERDLLEWRETVDDGRYKQQTEHDAEILPAEAIVPIKDVLAPRASKLAPVDETTTAASSSLSSSNRHKAWSGKINKATTAASFFANHKSKNGSDAAQKPSEMGKSTSVTNNTSNLPKKPPTPMPAKENKVRANQVAPVESYNAKESCSKNGNNQSKAPVAGNADDFEADEEESDDDDDVRDRQNKQAARRKAVQEANRQSEEAAIPEEHDSSDNNGEAKVLGAMDAFATATRPPQPAATSNQTDGTRQRKRRKKLVEETVMVNGYLRTETKAIWEDIPSDEEEKEKEQERKRVEAKKVSGTGNNKKGTASSKSLPQQGMKQKSLMGFFSKKG